MLHGLLAEGYMLCPVYVKLWLLQLSLFVRLLLVVSGAARLVVFFEFEALTSFVVWFYEFYLWNFCFNQ